MPRNRHRRPPADTLTDPFQERSAIGSFTARVLGGTFRFETQSAELYRLAASTYAKLPAHKLSAHDAPFRIRLIEQPADAELRLSGMPRPVMLSGADMLGAATPGSSFAIVAPRERTALIVVSPAVLSHSYEIRYELIEFAVFTLAARAQGLVPLHAAGVGERGRGIILIGDSGAGKSTLAFQCGLSGLELLSEDSLFVAPGSLLTTGVANFMHLRGDSLRFFPSAIATLVRGSPVIRRRSGITKFEIDARRPQFRLAPAPLRVVAIVFLSAAAGRPAALLAPVRPPEARRRLRATQPYAVSQEGWKEFLEQASGVATYELRRASHPRDAVACLRDLLADARPAGAGPR